MAKPDQPEPDTTPWGTWEELLLASAVNRHGPNSWDSVATEIIRRTTLLHHQLLTPRSCKEKYRDLKRRFKAPENSAADDDDDGAVPWLDELRQLRVAELRRQVERHDLSIVSLQLEVKRLEEEREQSENGKERSDLRVGETEPESVQGEPVRTEKPDPDEQSVSESNTTDSKRGKDQTGGEKDMEGLEPVGTGKVEEEPVSGSAKPVKEESCNGSSDSIEREPVRELVKVEPAELWESAAESKGGEEGTDLQSSASKSRKEGSDTMLRGSKSGDERGTGLKGISGEPRPLDHLLETGRSHTLGSVFRLRLKSLESLKYRNLIKQHVDFETVQNRLEEGWYSGCSDKFFRDLLLLVNNIIVFFGKKSSEAIAATEFRQLITKEMAQRNANADMSATKQKSMLLVSLPSKQPPEPSDSLLLKPNIAVPMIVCRKRSSIAAKASASSGSDRKREKTVALAEVKPAKDLKNPKSSSPVAEDQQITKKITRDNSQSSKKNGENLSSPNPDRRSEETSNRNQGKSGSPKEHSSEPRSGKTNPIMRDVKKRSAANFLNRMRRSSSSKKGQSLETLRSSVLNADNGKGGAEQKRTGNNKHEGNKDQVTTRNAKGRQSKEQESPSKRSVGRPPKRAAAPTPLSTAAGKRNRAVGETEALALLTVAGKRGREVGETETVASKQPRKRLRK
ncbi:hypothetical protein RJ639_042689 [Escallonia herrerae]|uniref:Bromo domain-containing protein n=1 Tax=Escallonia herrerae TaxID=1293975 RepID=A0AA89B174_9ASTE|nr:hypothetical protein RJ639_042689 [Escallonia herrerae]